MQNEAGEFVDLYLPRKCYASNSIIGAKDHTSVQTNVAEVDKVTGRMGESDDCILRLSKADGIVSKNFD
ncbi:40S ribosomal protein S21 [Saguinus oedipus]|uniref:40S ribosomal protein S21 n=1 Tax=Saguinus oedipus TaxID=9490 RepID=A0ABQ9VU83_SAGOE|nr:40S ribosomal protein S21 [Saguinus oedipus]